MNNEKAIILRSIISDLENTIETLYEIPNMERLIKRRKEQIAFLAELEAEKPEEDNALAIAKIIALNDRELEDDAKLIQQFSDNRIAEKCAECVGKLPAFPSRPEER